MSDDLKLQDGVQAQSETNAMIASLLRELADHINKIPNPELLELVTKHQITTEQVAGLSRLEKVLGEEVSRIAATPEAPMEGKDIFMAKDGQNIGLHAVGMTDDKQNWYQFEAWQNVYDKDWNFICSAARIFGPLEEEKAAWLADGWVTVHGPQGRKDIE